MLLSNASKPKITRYNQILPPGNISTQDLCKTSEVPKLLSEFHCSISEEIRWYSTYMPGQDAGKPGVCCVLTHRMCSEQRRINGEMRKEYIVVLQSHNLALLGHETHVESCPSSEIYQCFFPFIQCLPATMPKQFPRIFDNVQQDRPLNGVGDEIPSHFNPRIKRIRMKTLTILFSPPDFVAASQRSLKGLKNSSTVRNYPKFHSNPPKLRIQTQTEDVPNVPKFQTRHVFKNHEKQRRWTALRCFAETLDPERPGTFQNDRRLGAWPTIGDVIDGHQLVIQDKLWKSSFRLIIELNGPFLQRFLSRDQGQPWVLPPNAKGFLYFVPLTNSRM